MTTKEQQQQQEAAQVEAMHEQWATPVADVMGDDEDFTWEAPTPTADELARLRARVAQLEAQLAAVPVIALRWISWAYENQTWDPIMGTQCYDDLRAWLKRVQP